jgi:hypothetical protein
MRPVSTTSVGLTPGVVTQRPLRGAPRQHGEGSRAIRRPASRLRESDRQGVVYAAAAVWLMPRWSKRVCMWIRRVS